MAELRSGAYKPLAPAADRFLSLKFDAPAFLRALRDELGQFISAQQTVNVSRQVAEQIQAQQVQNLQDAVEGHGRAQRSTHFLLNALRDPAYISYNASGFVVGTQRVLGDAQIAKYWRGLEMGSSVHVGRLLHGFFTGDEGGRRYPALEERRGRDVRLIQIREHEKLPENRQSTDDRFVKRRHGGSFPFAIEIRRPIPEYAYLRRAVEEWPAAKIGEEYAAYMRQRGIVVRIR